MEKYNLDYPDVDEIKSRKYKKRHSELMGYNKKYLRSRNNVSSKKHYVIK